MKESERAHPRLVKVDNALWSRAVRAAEKMGITTSELVRRAIEKYVGRKK